MMRCMGRGVAVLMAAGLGSVSSVAAQEATSYPNQIVRIVVPFSAGSNTDGQARIIADK